VRQWQLTFYHSALPPCQASMRMQPTRHLIMLNTAAALGVPEHEITEQPMLSVFNNRASAVELVRWRIGGDWAKKEPRNRFCYLRPSSAVSGEAAESLEASRWALDWAEAVALHSGSVLV
jgi:hypothetical protein